ncbi:MAG: HD domain-containing protein, partial [Clostridia bacterium]|nr:HD domain-containing protein [Clostridia bacterium]
FMDYTRRFYDEQGRENRFLALKTIHTGHVAQNARAIAEAITAPPIPDPDMAEAVGWLHDVGRYTQLTEFGSFYDANTINHGQRGRDVLEAEGILNTLPAATRDNILLAVQISQYQHYLTRWNYVIDPLILCWNRRQWQTFPPDVQAGLQRAAQRAGRFQKALARVGQDNGESLQRLRTEFNYIPEVPDPLAHLQAQGMDVLTPNPQQIAALAEQLEPVRQKWIPRIGQAVYQAACTDLQQ